MKVDLSSHFKGLNWRKLTPFHHFKWRVKSGVPLHFRALLPFPQHHVSCVGAILLYTQFWRWNRNSGNRIQKETDSPFPWEGKHVAPVFQVQMTGCPGQVRALKSSLSWRLLSGSNPEFCGWNLSDERVSSDLSNSLVSPGDLKRYCKSEVSPCAAFASDIRAQELQTITRA